MAIKNWESSVKKWTRVRELIKKKRLSIYDLIEKLQDATTGSCGFCKEFGNPKDSFESSITCKRCPLYPKTCGDSCLSDSESTYWKISDLISVLNEENKPDLLEFVDKMIRAIKRHKDKF